MTIATDPMLEFALENMAQFSILCEALFLEDGFQLEEFDRLGVKMELVSSFSDCPDVLRSATVQVTRSWLDFKRHLSNSFAKGYDLLG